MSVINKVLRDLDKRDSPSNRPSSDPVRRYTVGVEATAPPRRKASGRSRRWVWPMVLLLLLAAGGAGGWFYQLNTQVAASNVPLILQLKDDDVLNLPAAAPVAPVENTVVAVRPVDPVVVAEPVTAKPVEPVPEPKAAPVVVPLTQPAPPVVSPPTVTAKTPPVSEPMPKPAAPQAAVAAADARGKVPASSPATAPPPAQRQQQAARDALVQAQTCGIPVRKTPQCRPYRPPWLWQSAKTVRACWCPWCASWPAWSWP